MTERFESLIIGSAYEGSEGLFAKNDIETEPTLTREQVAEYRKERGIFPDAQERLGSALEKADLKQVVELGNGLRYPTLDEWVEHRISNRRGTKFYPTFAQNTEGQLVFCKVQLSDNPGALNGLRNEMKRLDNIPKGVTAPQLINYLEPDEYSAALLVVEAIPWSEGSVAKAENWSEENAANAAQQIKILEESPSAETPQTETHFFENAIALLEGAGDTVETKLKDQVREIIEQSRTAIKTSRVHGDACLKNIIVPHDKDKSVIFVDWELEERGFLGQDAAKLWSGLAENPTASKAFISSYLRSPDNTIDISRKTALTFGVLVENLAHLKWRNEQIIKKGRQGEFPALQREIDSFNRRIEGILIAREQHQ